MTAREDASPPATPSGEGCTGGFPVPAERPQAPGPSEPRLLTRVNFERLGGHVVLPVRVNESRVLEMVLDTGMSAPIILLGRPRIVQELDLKEGQEAMIGGAGGQEPRQGFLFPGARVSIGELELTNQTLIAMGEGGEPSPCIHDGVIGKSIFDRYLVEIDFDSSVLSIHEGAIPDSQDFVSLPLEFSLGIPTITADVEIEDGRKIPVRLVLDLGARHALSLHFNDEKGIAAPQKTLAAVVGRGMQGEVSGKIGRLRALRLGPFAFSDVVSSFTDVEGGAACASQGLAADGNLGTEILNRFRLILNYPGGRLLLKPNSRFEDPFDYNMAGLSLERQRDGSYLVRSVVGGSPGGEAGIERGDRIVGIDDQELTSNPRVEFMGRFQRDGSSLKVKVERAGTRFDRILKLRRLI